MSVSSRIKEMATEDRIGYTDAAVCEKTGIGFATWRKWMSGVVPSEATILQFCAGLELSADRCREYIREREKIIGRDTPVDKLIITALELAPISNEGKRAVYQAYREQLNKQVNHSNAA